MMFEPSQRQKDIFEVWANSDENVLVNAVAGSGKTTLLMQLLKRFCASSNTLFLAFNKSIQEEITERIEYEGLLSARARTMHSLGLEAVRAAYPKVFIKSGNSKNFQMLMKVQNKHKSIFKYMNWKDKMKLSFCLMDMNDASRMFLTDTFSEVCASMINMGKVVSDHKNLEELWDTMVELRYESYEKKTVEVDFTDMIYLPVLKDLKFLVRPEYLLMDEVQDFNLCQHRMIDNLIAQGTVKKWIAVGDRNQSIYGFSGAFSESFDLFYQKPGEVREMPLDICYRCDTDIVDSANEVYDVMVPYKTESGSVEEIDSLGLIEDNSMVLCRNSAPLVDLYFKLLGENRDCYIKGNEILLSILKFIKPFRSLSIYQARQEMRADQHLLESKSREGSLELYLLKENIRMFDAVCASVTFPGLKVSALESKIKNLFSNRRGSIVLTTIHKAKGLEADTVYILNEDLIPAKFCKGEEQLKQEENLRYVARTRAKHKLYFLNL